MVIAAEASADVHAADVVRALSETRSMEVFGMAGPKLRSLGVEPVARTEEASVMGLTEVVPALPRIIKVMKRLEAVAASRKPDVALLVDSPDLNLRMAARLRRLGIPILYYIAPMVWAWRSGRIKQVAGLVDRLCVILPFEEEIWREGGVDAVYVGNPLLDHLDEGLMEDDVASLRQELHLRPNFLTVALLPGSRRTEVRSCLGPMLQAVNSLSKITPAPLQAVISVAPTIDESWLRELVAKHAEPSLVHLVTAKASRVLESSDLALISSGTATLEAVLVKTPMVVVYRVSTLTWLLGRILVRTPFVSLPNLLAGRRVVRELLQREMTPLGIASEMKGLLPKEEGRERMLAEFSAIRAKLGEPGAAKRVAKEVLGLMGLDGDERKNE